jgi:hypothetical protein
MSQVNVFTCRRCCRHQSLKKVIGVIGPKSFQPDIEAIIGAITGGIVIFVCRVFLTFAKFAAEVRRGKLGPTRSTKTELNAVDYY